MIDKLFFTILKDVGTKSKTILSVVIDNIFNDCYSIVSDENNIILNLHLNKGIDSNNNVIIFYNMSKIIPFKFNESFLEDNIYSLCNYLIKKELMSL